MKHSAIIQSLYETVFNPKLDSVDSIDIDDNGLITVYYYYDGEPAYHEFDSFQDFLMQCSKAAAFLTNK